MKIVIVCARPETIMRRFDQILIQREEFV